MLPRSSLCAYQGRSNWSCDQSKKAGKARDRNPKLCWRARIAECEITRSYLIRVFCQLNQTRPDWSSPQKSCAIVLPTTVHIVNVCILCVIRRSKHVAFGIYLMFVYCAYISAIVYFLERFTIWHGRMSNTGEQYIRARQEQSNNHDSLDVSI